MEPERDLLRRPQRTPLYDDDRTFDWGTLIAALSHPHPRRREAVVQALSALPLPEAFDLLLLCLDDEEASVRACAAEALGHSADARATLPLLRAVYDTDAEVRFRAAVALEQIRPTVGAALRVRAWEYVVARDTRNVYALCHLSLAHFAAGDFSAAESVAFRAVEEHSDFFYPYTVLAHICTARGALDAAREAYRCALELHPNHLPTRLQLAELLLRSSAPAEALAECKEAARLAPNHPEVHYTMGVCLTRLNDPEKAMRSYRRCLRLDPEHHRARNALGLLYKRQGMLEDAMRAFQRAILSCPDDDEAIANLGDCVVALFDPT